jgi:hypothetical protein
MDSKHNTDIWAELNIYRLGNTTEHRKRDWYEHIVRMEESRLPYVLYNIHLQDNEMQTGPKPDAPITSQGDVTAPRA